MYVQVDVIIDGALEESELLSDVRQLQQFINHVKHDAISNGQPTEVYTVDHFHPIGADCMCAQYETSHKPDYQWNIA